MEKFVTIIQKNEKINLRNGENMFSKPQDEDMWPLFSSLGAPYTDMV